MYYIYETTSVAGTRRQHYISKDSKADAIAALVAFHSRIVSEGNRHKITVVSLFEMKDRVPIGRLYTEHHPRKPRKTSIDTIESPRKTGNDLV